MKRILITGKNSYIGNSFEERMKETGEKYLIDKISLKDNSWKEQDFSRYDVIFHVAGIAHADVSKASEETKKLYYKVNCDLAEETAKKYKNDLNGKVGQFIYMSSIIVYGIESNLTKKRVITSETEPRPSNFYGDSKLKAEKKLRPLEEDNFKVVILRPPMIYGKGSKGNFPALIQIANKFSIFPAIRNERSMLFIGNLCVYVKQIIDEENFGLFFPQNNEHVSTVEIVKTIAKAQNKQIHTVSYFNWLIKLLSFFPGKIGNLVNKAFGSLVYEHNETNSDFFKFEDTIVQSIGDKHL
ncbi:sugar nucleotide-binding protein [Tetragenococcus koreensis]|uniref:sugar nucleotide-binding protein n=1 Tax=Tetragenococcus koreensis TaxID=290335 RepID=UPI001F3713A5|nr:sugar nucleotide-binding protein [Tetragenococcus koreensis]MCF1619984.1 sugar nucleotide-binding protein [Tetragenococcus koreensis]MCF1657477.1 sugar nucleotide-binding protein [Tetragenococcus koreensis]